MALSSNRTTLPSGNRKEVSALKTRRVTLRLKFRGWTLELVFSF